MKLPGNASMPVQSLGREDSAAAMSATVAKANVMNGVAGLVETYENVKDSAALSEGVAKWHENDAKLRSTLTESKTIPVGDLPKDLAKSLELGDAEHVETYRVANELYDRSEKELYTELKGKLKGRKAQAAFDQQIFRRKSQTISEINASSIRQERESRMAEYDSAVDVAMKIPDRDEAMALGEMSITAAYESGIYDNDDYNEGMKELHETVDYGHYQRQLETDDTDMLAEQLSEIVTGDNWLSEAQVKDLSGRYNSRIDSLEAKEKAEVKEQRERESKSALVDAMIEMSETGNAYGISELKESAAGMESSDIQTLINWTDGFESKRKTESDKGQVDIASYLVTTVITGSNRKDVIEELGSMYNGGEGKLSGADYAKALSDLNSIEKIVVDAPRFKEVEDDIYLRIGKASKDQFMPGQDPTLAVYLGDALKALYSEADKEGLAFDPVTWWEENQGAYLPPSHDEAAYGEYLVIDMTTNDGKIDRKATLAKINAIPDTPENLAKKTGAVRYMNTKVLEESR